MKLYWNSIAFAVMHELLLYGNLPYSALRLLPFPYESTKDAAQKLIRAGYVGVIKAKHLKGLYATAAGTRAAQETYERSGYDFLGRHPVVYHASKLERIHRLHETELLFAQADIGCPAFQNSRDLKRELEQKPRAADKLKYSRFVGTWNNNGIGWVVYHFGRTNMQLNESGEFNARLLAEEQAQGYAQLGDVPTLILGSNTDTALSILRYTDWFYHKSEGQRNHLKNVHYHLPMNSERADTTYFLSIGRAGIQILSMMCSGGWDERMKPVHDAYLGKGFPVCGMLDCRLKDMYCHHAYSHMQESDKLLIVCFDWQAKLAETYFADLADRMEIWVQEIALQSIAEWFVGTKLMLPWNPRQLGQTPTQLERRCADVSPV